MTAKDSSVQIMETKYKAKKFILSIRQRKAFTGLNIMQDGECKDWFYYYDITGFFNDRYFSIDINCHKISNNVNVRIVDTTDCKSEIFDLLCQFELLHH